MSKRQLTNTSSHEETVFSTMDSGIEKALCRSQKHLSVKGTHGNAAGKFKLILLLNRSRNV